MKRQLPAPLSADERVSDSIARCSFRGCLSALSATFVKSIVDNAMFERTGKIRPSIWGQNPLVRDRYSGRCRDIRHHTLLPDRTWTWYHPYQAHTCERSSCPRGYPSHVTNVTAKASRPTRLLQADRALEVPCAPLTKKSSLSSAASLNPQTAFQQENSFHSHHASQIHYEIS